MGMAARSGGTPPCCGSLAGQGRHFPSASASRTAQWRVQPATLGASPLLHAGSTRSRRERRHSTPSRYGGGHAPRSWHSQRGVGPAWLYIPRIAAVFGTIPPPPQAGSRRAPPRRTVGRLVRPPKCPAHGYLTHASWHAFSVHRVWKEVRLSGWGEPTPSLQVDASPLVRRDHHSAWTPGHMKTRWLASAPHTCKYLALLLPLSTFLSPHGRRGDWCRNRIPVSTSHCYCICPHPLTTPGWVATAPPGFGLIWRLSDKEPT